VSSAGLVLRDVTAFGIAEATQLDAEGCAAKARSFVTIKPKQTNATQPSVE